VPSTSTSTLSPKLLILRDYGGIFVDIDAIPVRARVL
jgi:mannosyltransferase OCH1-like enzyme